MAEDDRRSVVIDIKKPKLFYKAQHVTQKANEPVNKIKKTKFKVKSNTLPVIDNIKPVSIATVAKEEVLLPYLRYSRNQERDRLKQKLGIGITDHHKVGYKDVYARIGINDPIDQTYGITDIDPTFFTCLRSSLNSSYVAPYKSLKYLLNSQLKWRQEVGYRNDCMLNIDVNFKKEKLIYDNTCRNCKKQVKYLDEFISDDYKKSMNFLSKWEELKVAVTKKTLELQCLATIKFTMTSKILGLDYRFGLQQKYGRFLYYLSPPSWRLKNRNFARSIEIEAKGFDFGISSDEDTFIVVFDNLKRECVSGLVKPALYFQHPNDLLQIFDGIEQQQLHHFTHVARLAPHTSFLRKGIKLFKDIITQDSAGVITIIGNFEKMLSFCEEQCSQLEEKFFKILNGLFYESVGAPDVLKFQFHLEFCYAKVFNEKPMNLGILGTAKALEGFYMLYMKRLESVTSDNIKIAVKQFIEFERSKLKRAKVATRELSLFRRLERALLRAYAPMTSESHGLALNTVSELSVKQRPRKQLQSKTTTIETRKILTESEIDYLLLFTDWTEKDDPALYLRSLSLESKASPPN